MQNKMSIGFIHFEKDGFAFALMFLSFAFSTLWLPSPSSAQEKVDFQNQILPILRAHCISCHGSDQFEADLRLDSAAGVANGGVHGPVVAAGKVNESLLIQVVRGTSKEIERMPPDGEGRPLTEDEIALLTKWVDEGATLPSDANSGRDARLDHWAFQPIERRAQSPLRSGDRANSAIDVEIETGLSNRSLSPSPRAPAATLLRRIAIDLTGIPPTIEEYEEFQNDSSPNALAKQVDRLLASPSYGERWGRWWLDQARYADSDGYTNDVPRVMWKYRDWVVDSINSGMSWKDFIIEQLAGDMLPNATVEQKIATGFHRNTQHNREGGSDEEQYRVERVVDRVNTTGQVFLGLTLGCARCHEHKYDPISQSEYFELYSYFNNCDEPEIVVPTDETLFAEWQRSLTQLREAQKRLAAHDTARLPARKEWEVKVETATAKWEDLLDPTFESKNGSQAKADSEGGFVVLPGHPKQDHFFITGRVKQHSVQAIQLEVLLDDSLPGKGPGWAGGNFVLHELRMEIIHSDGSSVPVQLNGAIADHSQPNYGIEGAVDNDPKTGWAINLAPGTPGTLNQPRSAVIFLREATVIPADSKLRITIEQNQDNYLLGRFRLRVTDQARENVPHPSAERLAEVARKPEKDRSAEEKKLLDVSWQLVDQERLPFADEVTRLSKVESELKKRGTTTTLAMTPTGTPRKTHVQIRGEFLRLGKEVGFGIPAALQQASMANDPPDRLKFAEWLVSPHNPLTSRVLVNRVWLQLFGQGLVTTESDFGLQGTRPTYPDLLDDLAYDFLESEMDFKQLLREIVLTETYQQSSQLRSELIAVDPTNLYFARQSRLRLEAETIRDSFLSLSNTLTLKLHGPSVFPPQPDGVMKMTRDPGRQWKVSPGEDRYRRGLYTYFWRSTPHPFLKQLDAPESNSACTRRERSNTPLQSLILLNDEACAEAAQIWAVRLLDQPTLDSDEKRIQFLFQQAFGRMATQDEVHLLLELGESLTFDSQEKVTLYPATSNWSGDSTKLRKWTAITRCVLNLDEFLNRE